MDAYFSSLAIGIEGSVASGVSQSYGFGLSIENNGDAVVLYTQYHGLTLSAGADKAIRL
jgi:hypothetical protein